MARRRRKQVLLGIATALAVAVFLPANASGLTLTTQPGPALPDYMLMLDDSSGQTNSVVVTIITNPVNGKLDIVIGDTTAGISDPVASPCARVDPDIVRCPAEGLTDLDILLGLLGDSLAISVAHDVGVAGAFPPVIYATLGGGRDRVGLDVSVGDTLFKIDGGSGRDTMLGSSGRDFFSAGPGRDILFGGPGDDKLKGGPGNDKIDCGSGKRDVGVGGPGRDLGTNCEKVKH